MTGVRRCDKVPIAVAAYRASVHEATGYTPNWLMFFRETRAPLDVVVGILPGEQRSYESVDQFVAERQQTMTEVNSVVRAASCGTTEKELRCSSQADAV